MRVAGLTICRGATGFASACALGATVIAQTTVGSGTLSAADRAEIYQLVARYSHALETVDDGAGPALAALFTPDGTLVDRGTTFTGRPGLEAFAAGRRTSASASATLVTNVVIESAPGGASGSVYVLVTQLPAQGGRPAVVGGGRFEDRYRRTAQGWRIARRQFVASRFR